MEGSARVQCALRTFRGKTCNTMKNIHRNVFCHISFSLRGIMKTEIGFMSTFVLDKCFSFNNMKTFRMVREVEVFCSNNV